MRAFIWRYVEDVTTSYHSDGGVLIVAPDLEAARDVLRVHQIQTLTERYDGDPDDYEPAGDPHLVLDLAPGALPSMIVFPNAGCC